jgi:hypothetical protein
MGGYLVANHYSSFGRINALRAWSRQNLTVRLEGGAPKFETSRTVPSDLHLRCWSGLRSLSDRLGKHAKRGYYGEGDGVQSPVPPDWFCLRQPHYWRVTTFDSLKGSKVAPSGGRYGFFSTRYGKLFILRTNNLSFARRKNSEVLDFFQPHKLDKKVSQTKFLRWKLNKLLELFVVFLSRNLVEKSVWLERFCHILRDNLVNFRFGSAYTLLKSLRLNGLNRKTSSPPKIIRAIIESSPKVSRRVYKPDLSELSSDGSASSDSEAAFGSGEV